MMIVQMHGEPGSGKTTLAKALGPRIPAIHIDKDVIASAIMYMGIPKELAGPTSYEVMWDLAKSFLAQGYSVIADSPAFWPIIEQTGHGLARDMGAAYFMIETQCPESELDRRLATRERLVSNPEIRYEGTRPGTREPSRARLILDSTRPVDELVELALEYIGLKAAS